MIEEILQNFSEDELHSLIPNSTIEFVTAISSLKNNDGFISKKSLCKLVLGLKGQNFVFDEKLRSKLIDRMSPKMLLKAFPEIGCIENEVQQNHYKLVAEWANKRTSDFAERVGLSEIYTDNLSSSEKISGITRITPDYPIYDYQDNISKSVIKNFNSGKSRQIIHLPTGAGKTRTAMNIASLHLRENPKNIVLWLADREELCSQAFLEFGKAWRALGNRPISSYAFYSDANESLSGIDSGFIVGGLHKLLSIKRSDSRQLKILYAILREKVTLVIFDEAHKAVAPTYSEIVEDFISSTDFDAFLLGLTATPGRKFLPDGLSEEDRKLSDFFGENKVSMKVLGYLSPIDYLVEQKYLAKAEFFSLNYDHSKILAYELSDFGGPKTLKALADNPERNSRILEVIKKECSFGSYIIVFACSVEHAVNLSASLILEGIRATSIDSKNDSTQSRRSKIKQYLDGKIQVIVNFNVLTAGFDAPRTNVAIIAKPMDSLVQYLQMAGRAMRGSKSGGNNSCRIYTVMDDIPQFRSVNIAFEYWNDMWLEE